VISGSLAATPSGTTMVSRVSRQASARLVARGGALLEHREHALGIVEADGVDRALAALSQAGALPASGETSSTHEAAPDAKSKSIAPSRR